MQKDWLKDLLEWSPLFLVLLAGGALSLYSKWRLRKVDRSLKELWGRIIREAESGDAYSQFQAGRMYQKGNGVSRDAVLADEWFHKALPGLNREANDGNRDAAFCLYECFREGLAVQKDDAKALFWLQRAAEEGEPEAMFTLALEYREGGLVEKNDDLFMHWLRKAAEEGDEGDAQYLLGACYEHGNGVPQDLNLAREWYERAADSLASGAEEALERLKGS